MSLSAIFKKIWIQYFPLLIQNTCYNSYKPSKYVEKLYHTLPKLYKNVIALVLRKWPRCTLFSRRVRKSFNGSNINNQSADIGKPQSGPCLALVHLFLSSSSSLSSTLSLTFKLWSSATSVFRTWPPRVIFGTILLLFEIHALPKAWAKDKMNQNLANRGHKVYILLVPNKYPPQKVDLIW